ncbi:cytochrome P450 [Pholiota conissans]|uniref:Cytochrome P450 n=1 Tax=Pholiota conissans TaxID=109636 RepID=A0A9P6D0T8_9AGAR|nr:cytochrome P450 [Pholiota conissans]
MPGPIVITSLAYLLAAFAALYMSRKRNPLPPGPKGLPLIGNLHELPYEYPWLTYAQWAKKYGPIFSFKVFGSTTIVINSFKVATELIEKRSTNYSDRPRMIMADELMEWAWSFIHMPYADRWRRHRKMFHQYFQPRVLSTYHPSQTEMTIKLLRQLSCTPEEFGSHIKHYVGSLALKVAYGYEVKPKDDFYVQLVGIAMEPLLLVVHGNHLVDFLPFLKHIPEWFPGAGFKRLAKDGAKRTRDLRDIPFNAVKKSMADGSAQQSFAYEILEKVKANNPNSQEEEEIIKNCAGIIYLAGSDTTSSFLLAWMLAMAQYPQVQRTAQEQLDKVVGKARLPEFSDRSSLPYFEAMMLETLRWHSIVPLAAPHRAIQEDEFEGYNIPAGATVTINTCLCPGRHFAMDTAWIAMASILTTYHIFKAADITATEIDPTDFTDGLVSHPKPYKLRIMRRPSTSIVFT